MISRSLVESIRYDIDVLEKLDGFFHSSNTVYPRLFYTSAHEIFERVLRAVLSLVGYTSTKHNLRSLLSVLEGKNPKVSGLPEFVPFVTVLKRSLTLTMLSSMNYNAVRFNLDYSKFILGLNSSDIVFSLRELLRLFTTVFSSYIV